MTFAFAAMFLIKILQDLTFGWKALKEVRELRVAVSTRLDGIETRLDVIEKEIH